MDLKACAAAREAVGPDIHLMIDAFHWYSRTEALELGRGLEKLGFAWIEEPLDEQSMSTYAWLADEPRHPGAGAGERGGQALRPGRVDQGRGLRHPADRRARRRRDHARR